MLLHMSLVVGAIVVGRLVLAHGGTLAGATCTGVLSGADRLVPTGGQLPTQAGRLLSFLGTGPLEAGTERAPEDMAARALAVLMARDGVPGMWEYSRRSVASPLPSRLPRADQKRTTARRPSSRPTQATVTAMDRALQGGGRGVGRCAGSEQGWERRQSGGCRAADEGDGGWHASRQQWECSSSWCALCMCSPQTTSSPAPARGHTQPSPLSPHSPHVKSNWRPVGCASVWGMVVRAAPDSGAMTSSTAFCLKGRGKGRPSGEQGEAPFIHTA